MNLVIKSALKTLQKSQTLLDKITDDQLCNTSVSPYCSSIGTHIRHILDFYDCLFSLNSENQIDLTVRSRIQEVESNCSCAKDYLNTVINKLTNSNFEMHKTVSVIDDFGYNPTTPKVNIIN